MHNRTVMRAIRSGIIKGDPGRPRTIITEGKSTAHAGHPIVREHPHLWGEIVPEFPIEEDAFDAAYQEAGANHTEALRAILTGLADRGYELVAPPEVDVTDQLVALVFSAIDHPRVPCAGDCGVTDPHAHQVDAAGVSPAPGTEDGPHPVAGDLRRTESGQLQEWGDGMWHDVDDPPAVAPNPDPTGPVETEPGCMHPDCVLEHPHIGPAVLATDAPLNEGQAAAEPASTEPEPAADLGTTEGRKAVREWAEEHGYEVKPTGPLPQVVVDAYKEAHPGA